MYEYYREKLYVDHFWGFEGVTWNNFWTLPLPLE